MSSTSLFGHEINFVSLIIFIAYEDKMRVVVRSQTYGTILICPLSAVWTSSRYPRLTGIVGFDNELESKKLQLKLNSREVPPRPLNSNIIRKHRAPRQLRSLILGKLSYLSRKFAFCSITDSALVERHPVTSNRVGDRAPRPAPSHITVSSTARTRSGAGSSRSAAPRSSSAR